MSGRALVIMLLIGSMAAVGVYFGMFLMLGGSHIVSYASCDGVSFDCGPETLVWGLQLVAIGALLIGSGLSSFAYALRRAFGRTNRLIGIAGYVLLLSGSISTVFIATMTTIFRRPIGDIGDGLPAGYPLAILGAAVGMSLILKDVTATRRNSSAAY
jgi:hypothetical protein